MSLTEIIVLVLTGLIAGFLSGALGIGGAVLTIAAMVFFLGVSQQEAQGTSLAFMLPPVGIMAVISYHKAGYVNWKYAAVLAVMFFIGAYLGSVMTVQLPEKIIKKGFGILLLVISYKMIMSK